MISAPTRPENDIHTIARSPGLLLILLLMQGCGRFACLLDAGGPLFLRSTSNISTVQPFQ